MEWWRGPAWANSLERNPYKTPKCGMTFVAVLMAFGESNFPDLIRAKSCGCPAAQYALNIRPKLQKRIDGHLGEVAFGHSKLLTTFFSCTDHLLMAGVEPTVARG